MVLDAKPASEPDAIAGALREAAGEFVSVGLEACHAKAAMVAMNRGKSDRNDSRPIAHLERDAGLNRAG